MISEKVAIKYNEHSSKLNAFIKPKALNPQSTYLRTWVVARLRIILPIIAASLVFFIFIWPSLTDESNITPKVVVEVKEKHDIVNNEASHMNFSMTDKSGNPIEITAAKVLEIGTNHLQLTAPNLSITHGKLGKMGITGLTGIYKPSSNEIIVEGNVVINHHDGHKLQSDGIVFNLDSGVGKTTSPGVFTSPFGIIHAKEIEISTIDKKITLRGRPVITFLQRTQDD